MSEYDTKPTWETVLERMEAGFAEINRRLTAIESRLDAIEARLDKIEKRMSRQDDKIAAFIQDVIDLQREMKQRV
jgi:chromosome segregation ATPase